MKVMKSIQYKFLFIRHPSEFKIDNEEFYNNVKYLEKIDEFLTISKYFLKYIANTLVTYEAGSANIIEIARCEDNIPIILSHMAYKEKGKVKKLGEFIKYKNLPITILIYKLEKPEEQAFSTTNVSGSAQQPNVPRKKENLPPIIEITGYCYETDKESLMATLADIQNKLSPYIMFESEIKKNI